MRLVIFILSALLIATSIHAATIHVPADQPTIQSGINAAVNGDTVLVAPGVYSGNGNSLLDFIGKSVAVVSEAGPIATIIDLSGSGPLLNTEEEIVTRPIFSGFTVRNSTGQPYVMRCLGASIKVENCVFTNNHPTTMLLYLNGNPSFNNKAKPNDAELPSSSVVNCTFACNDAGSLGLLVAQNGYISVRVDYCLFFANKNANGNPVIHNGGSALIYALSTNIFANTGGDWIGEIEPSLGQNCNISLDPLVCDSASSDFQLQSISPCGRLNNPCGIQIGALPVACGTRTLMVPSQYPTIQIAVDSSHNNDTILVNSGTYSGNGFCNVIVVNKSLTIIGDLGGAKSVLTIDGGSSGFLIGPSDYMQEVSIQGFEIRGGATGIYCEGLHQQETSILDCKFSGLGTGIWGHGSYEDGQMFIFVENAAFDSNATGVLATKIYSSPTFKISSCSLVANGNAIELPESGGGASLIEGTLFKDNSTSVVGGAKLSNCTIFGGRIGIKNGCEPERCPSTTDVSNCVFEGLTDVVLWVGGAVFVKNSLFRYNLGSLAECPYGGEDYSGLDLDSCTLMHNNKGIWSRGRVLMRSCRYIENGSGLDIAWGLGKLTDCVFEKNDSVCVEVGTFAGVDVLGCTFYANSSSAMNIQDSYSTITRTLISDNLGVGIAYIGSSYYPPFVNCSDVHNNSAGNYAGISDQTGLNGNISADPFICDTANSDFHVMDFSPCASANNSCGQLIGALGIGCLGIPAVNAIAISGESPSNMKNHLPKFEWPFSTPIPAIQDSITIAVGADTNWTSAEMWDPGAVTSADTFVTYAGSPLVDGATYYLRLRVHNGYAWSPWYETSFRMNSVPAVPGIVGPSNDQVSPNLPMLIITNGSDAENDPITYDFEVYGDSALTQLEWQGLNIPPNGGNDTTVYQVGTLLAENVRHWWRVRAHDGYEYSEWTVPTRFWMNATEEAPRPFGLISPPDTNGLPVFDLLPTITWQASSDPDPVDTVRYKLEVAVNPTFSMVYARDSLLEPQFTLTDSLYFGTHYWWRVTAKDRTGNAVVHPTPKDFWTWALGDINHSHICDLSDLSALVSYLTGGGYVISPRLVGDLNGSCLADLTDLSMMVSYLTGGGAVFKVGCE